VLLCRLLVLLEFLFAVEISRTGRAVHSLGDALVMFGKPLQPVAPRRVCDLLVTRHTGQRLSVEFQVLLGVVRVDHVVPNILCDNDLARGGDGEVLVVVALVTGATHCVQVVHVVDGVQVKTVQDLILELHEPFNSGGKLFARFSYSSYSYT